MSKIIGRTTTTPVPRSDWNQVDETKADFILNKPENIAYINSTDNETITDVETGGVSNVVVDSALSTTSTNPVQNKVITQEINQLSKEIDDLEAGLNVCVDITDRLVYSKCRYSIGGVGSELSDDSFVEVQKYWYTLKRKVRAGDKFAITGLGGDEPRLWALTDTDNIILKKAKTTQQNDEVDVERDGYIYVNIDGTSTEYRVLQYMRQSEHNAEKLDEVVKKLSEEIDKKIDIPKVLPKNKLDPNNKCNWFFGGANYGMERTTAEISYYCELEKNTDYTVTKSNKTSRLCVSGCNELENRATASQLARNDSALKITFNSGNWKYVVIQVTTVDTYELPEWIQVEEGTESTEYVPYFSPEEADPNLYFAFNAFGEQIEVLPKQKVMEMVSEIKSVSGLEIKDHVSGDFMYQGGYIDHTGTDKLERLYAIWDNLEQQYPAYITSETLGQDQSETYDIRAYTINPHKFIIPNTTEYKPLKIILVGGIHGTENHSLYATTIFFKELMEKRYTDDNMRMLWNNCVFHVIPVMNPYGVYNNSRYNSRGVNLNRNFSVDWKYDDTENHNSGTAPESEAETQLVCEFIRNNSDAYLCIFPHNGNALSATNHKVAYARSNFVSDMAELAKIARKMDSVFKRETPELESVKAGCPTFQCYTNYYSGSPDKWYNYALGIRGFLLETAPGMDTDLFQIDSAYMNKKVQAMSIETIANLLCSFVYDNRDILSDDTKKEL